MRCSASRASSHLVSAASQTRLLRYTFAVLRALRRRWGSDSQGREVPGSRALRLCTDISFHETVLTVPYVTGPLDRLMELSGSRPTRGALQAGLLRLCRAGEGRTCTPFRWWR